MEGGACTLEQFATQKFANFLRYFEKRLIACEVHTALSDMGVQKLLVALKQLEPFWGYARARDVDSLVALFEVSDFSNKDAVLQQFQDMRGEELDRFWQYVDLFLDLAKL